MSQTLKFMTFATFIENRGISNEVFDAKSSEEKVALLKEHTQGQEAYIKSIEDDVNSKVSKDEIKKMKEDLEIVRSRENKALTEAVSKQGLAITKLLDNLKGGGEKMVQNANTQIKSFIANNIDRIREIKKSGTGIIEMTVKAPGEDIYTTNASNPEGIPQLMGVQTAPPSDVNMRGVIVDGLVTSFNTNQAVFAYSETLPQNGDFEFIAEGKKKEAIDFTIETRYAEPCKIAATEFLTEEAVTDIPNLQSIATNFLKQKHDLKRQNALLFGTGVLGECTGATVYGRTFVAGAMANTVSNTNFMDVVNACITDIWTTHNYQDELNYQANVVLINPVDFFTELVSAKDLNGLPLYPSASLFNMVMIGGVSIIPMEDIPAGKIFVADMSKYNVSNYVGYSVRIGFINEQFIHNTFTIVGESRFHAFVRKLDEQAFIYDDIATIKTAITVVP